MIRKLTLSNFKCYDQHDVSFHRVSIVVGKNNAGKSTLIEALRLISLVSRRITTLSFKKPPGWTNLPRGSVGIMPSLSNIGFSTKNIINQFGESPARIKCETENGEIVEIFVNNDGELFAYAKNPRGRYIRSQTDARDLKQSRINILPQIGPLLEDEKVLEESYIRSSLHSNLVSRHFRNQLSYFHEYYREFKKLAEQTWPSLRIVDLIKGAKGLETIDPLLLVQESEYATEIGSMGHGLQMWLQTMWFLSRIPTDTTVVLDEPDVYMHADLQRKLIRLLRGRFHQIIIATHSLEIMAEVNPENMIIIDRRQSASKFAIDLPDIQSVIYNDIGSIHNLELARIWSSKKFIMVEGSDMSILKRLHDTLFPQSEQPFDNNPNSDIGGWGGWKYAIGSKYALRNAGDQSLKIYCILDSDYHIPPETEERIEEANKHKISLHIWSMKEIENYLLVPSAILRLLLQKKPQLSSKVSIQLLCDQIDSIIESYKSEITDDYASEIAKYYRPLNKIIDFTDNGQELKYEVKNINKVARKLVDLRWGNKKVIAPGKTVIKELNKWLSENYKINFGVIELARIMRKNEIPKEMKMVIEQIEVNNGFKI